MMLQLSYAVPLQSLVVLPMPVFVIGISTSHVDTAFVAAVSPIRPSCLNLVLLCFTGKG